MLNWKRQKRENGEFLLLLVLPLMMNILGKGVTVKGYNNMKYNDKIF